MKIYNPFRNLSAKEWGLWLGSITIVTLTFIFTGDFYPLTLTASLIGVTALIFVAKGDVLGQVLTVVFSIIYGIISFEFNYYGEMITYLGMTMPIALLSIYTWIKNPYRGTEQVKIHSLNKMQGSILAITTIIITFGFYFVLEAFSTANLWVSTVSIATSFSASCLMMLRSQFYAVAYAANDIVLIILWILATVEAISYLPMVICFIMFFINDIYGFLNWEKMRVNQTE